MRARTCRPRRSGRVGRPWRWAAVLARSAAADGSFWYSVLSTGVYCRPSCAARTPRPENVRFHASCADAENAGFRPCQRCKPQQPSAQSHHAEWVTQACRFIEADAAEGRAPTLDALAARLGLSSSHLHRIFKQATGLTPKAYAAAQREQRVRSALGHATDSVTEAIYEAGYQSSSRFYEKSAQVLGMTPARYRAVSPPSTTCSCPVVKLEASEARNTATLPISCGSASRPSGTPAARPPSRPFH